MTKFGVLVMTSALSAAALGQLNPIVERLPRANGPAPADCDTASTAPASTPRLVVAEIPPPPVSRTAARAPVAPPTASVKSLLRETQSAAERGDRDAFRDALARLRATLTGYPAGGEKRVADEAVRVYGDLDRLWTYQFEAPAGSFFEDSADVYKTLNAYPGWAEAVRRQTLTVGGKRVYPSTESRRFLVAEAARKIGVKAPPVTVARATPPASTTRRTTPRETAPPPALSPVKPRTTHTPAPKPAPTKVGTSKPKTSTPKPAAPKHEKVAEKPASNHEKVAKTEKVAAKPAPAPATLRPARVTPPPAPVTRSTPVATNTTAPRPTPVPVATKTTAPRITPVPVATSTTASPITPAPTQTTT
ncbi:MAG: hypothetical protein JOZ54_20770, partial [Acidobacteria bacterium]|nr:hypothetical protein [Acidobacteriota bacterium]